MIKGPKFCATTKGSKSEFVSATRTFNKKLILQELFFDKSFEDQSLIRLPSKKYFTSHNKELNDIISTLGKLEPTSKASDDNIDKVERQALEELKVLTKTVIEIKKADKTNTFVVMDKQSYRDKLVLEGHLNTCTYERASGDSNKKVFGMLTKLCKKYPGCLTKSEKKVVLNEDWKESSFYVLPKVHKSSTISRVINEERSEYIHMDFPSDLKSRPINGDVKSVTQGLSKIIEKILTPLSTQLKTYIKDEYDFLRKFPKNIPVDSYVLTCDVTSLYTSIPHDLGLKAINYWIEKLVGLIPARFTKNFILESIKLILENNFFIFDEVIYHQIIGTAMGKTFAPPYACLTVGFLEETILFPRLIPHHFSELESRILIDNFFRYIDDGIPIVPRSIQPNAFVAILNQMDPSIQYTITEPTQTIYLEHNVEITNFLSIKVIVMEDGKVDFDVYYKETNAHDYLHYDSHHPTHTKDNIPYSLAKRIIVITTDSRLVEKNLGDLRMWLRNQGYPNEIIELGIKNAYLQGPAQQTTSKTIPLITPFLANYDVTNTVHTAKDLIANSKDPRVRDAFKEVRFIQSYKQPPNLLRTLSHSAFTNGVTTTTPKKCGIFRCGRDICKICKLGYLQDCTSFETSNGTTWDVKCYATCQSKNTLYFIKCNYCDLTTKIGKTDNFRDRTNNHITGCRHGKSTDDFDNHVFICCKNRAIPHSEPFFKIWILMVLNDYQKLLKYERDLHLACHDTMNKPQL